MAKSVPRLKIIIFQIFKLNGFPLSIEAHIIINQMNTASNGEGVELQFHQSYWFKLTSNPLGKHYINLKEDSFSKYLMRAFC
jgi:hypothetical protein